MVDHLLAQYLSSHTKFKEATTRLGVWLFITATYPASKLKKQVSRPYLCLDDLIVCFDGHDRFEEVGCRAVFGHRKLD